ncbi:ATPase family AAA domain-containing protein 5 [Colletotrichum spaethianum]|uniref:ATPase family AAA domain-containing protein 5 n=1 Tax=Colletotrichum spaethianum TaxID=700344 RepID=A0AA37PCP4_9PEZI|nr:ATPase family AAA domain-containing protein 5 [Colletotrichum spaethianum]GKT49777.1 ATPase family AAA domain-containing protein 5 [Colletotrichum spaethianum]
MAPEGLDVSNQKLHPFFVPGKNADASKPDPATPKNAEARSKKQTRTSQQPSSDVEPYSSDIGEDGHGSKRQKTGGGNPPSSGKKRGRPRKIQPAPAVAIANNFSQANGVPLTSLVNEIPRTPLPAPSPANNTALPPLQAPTSAVNADGYPQSTETLAPSTGKVEPSKPTKVLKFNPKTGTIGSPPKPKPGPADTVKGAKFTKSPTKQSRIVTIKYGADTESRERIGPKIEQILATPSQTKTTPTKTTPRKPRSKAPKPDQDKMKANNTHPLFLAKSKNAVKSAETPPAPPKQPRATIFSSTPCSPKKQRLTPAAGKVQLPQFGVRSMGLKVPGACHPAWPAQGTAHVRGLSPGEEHLPARHHKSLSSRKSKGQPTNIFPGESVIDQLSRSFDTLNIAKTIQEATDDYEPPPPPELRLPEKHFESGRKLRQRIRPELRSHLPLSSSQDSDDELLTASTRKPHPAVARLYNSLETNLSAYDRSQCEELPWAHKYAPICAEEVLQSGQEGVLLKEWLQTLKVQSVDTGAPIADQKSTSKPGSATKKKRKRNKLDGFIVSSGDEAEFLPAISDDEDDWLPTPVHGSAKKTVVRKDVGKDASRLTNAVVLSGPHGCGKTAAVYAVAKELGFEVFEINASSRRNGKDVMEKVGDMTQNHLVQQHRQNGQGDGGDNVDNDTANDIKSGKQGTMTSFFKLKTAAKPKVTVQPETTEQSTVAAKSVKAKTQSQKQSLILLEEVDVLYEEDKQFWATIVSLIAQSKRPFVMTCNDETLVPFHNFVLYGILRFTPPPEILAVDTLLLIAANEGHALRRAAVSALYESKGYDLRASLMELNYWCQLGVGDRRGGFDWFYPRWPKGCDTDENGDVVRVVSEGTYLEGMGWVSRDPAIVSSPHAAEEELMNQCWQGLEMDLGNWHESLDMVSWADNVATSSAGDRAAALDAFSEFSDLMSAADLCSGGDFGLRFQEPLDPTQPGIPVKARDDFIMGRRLLEAPPLTTYTCTAKAIATSLKCGARQALQTAPFKNDTLAKMDCFQEDSAIRRMRHSFVHPTRDTVINRYDMAYAFDPIAVSEKASAAVSASLEPSVFDRTMRMITLEVAPYVRGIIGYDHRLMQDRMQRSGLLSESGRPGKRMRSTRAAYSALEGVARGNARKENYFAAELSTPLVMRTGGESWQAAVDEEMSLMSPGSSPVGANEVDANEAGGEMTAPVMSVESMTCDEMAEFNRS